MINLGFNSLGQAFSCCGHGLYCETPPPIRKQCPGQLFRSTELGAVIYWHKQFLTIDENSHNSEPDALARVRGSLMGGWVGESQEPWLLVLGPKSIAYVYVRCDLNISKEYLSRFSHCISHNRAENNDHHSKCFTSWRKDKNWAIDDLPHITNSSIHSVHQVHKMLATWE